MTTPIVLTKLEATMRIHVLGYPQRKAFPWGERAIKVKGKAFLFTRIGDAELSFSVKLPRTGMQALAMPFAKPTEYGLGQARLGDDPPREDDESADGAVSRLDRRELSRGRSSGGGDCCAPDERQAQGEQA